MLRRASSVFLGGLRASSATATAAPSVQPAAKPLEGMPGPRPVSFLGGTFYDYVRRVVTNGGDLLEAVDSYYRDYGRMIKHDMWGQKEVYVFHPDEMTKLFRLEGMFPEGPAGLIWPFQKYAEMRSITLSLGQSGPEWKRMRGALQKDIVPPSAAESYLELLDEPVTSFSQNIHRAKRLSDISFFGALDMFSAVMFGKGMNTTAKALDGKESDPDIRYAREARKTLEIAAKLSFDPLTKKFPGDKFNEFVASHDYVYNRGMELIDAAVAEYAQKGTTGTSVEPYFVRVMRRQEMTREEIISSLALFLMAGVDTTHHLLLWLFLNLARHPEVQDKLYEEITAVLGDGPLRADHQPKLKYLNSCMRESHRLTPTAPASTMRVLHTDAEIGGYHVPKGTRVHLAQASIQRDPSFVDNPKRFVPERWSDDAVKARKGTKSEVLDNKMLAEPFGFGARMCVGSRVAKGEVRALMSRVIRDWRFTLKESDPKYKRVLETMLVPSPFPEIVFTPRKR